MSDVTELLDAFVKILEQKCRYEDNVFIKRELNSLIGSIELVISNINDILCNGEKYINDVHKQEKVMKIFMPYIMAISMFAQDIPEETFPKPYEEKEFVKMLLEKYLQQN